MDKDKKKKGCKITAQCIGIVLVCFALGLFVGNTYNYQDLFANMLPHQVNRIHVLHSSSKMSEQGARVVLYALGNEDNDVYEINFSPKPQENGKIYNINGTLKNISDKHFTSIELNFSLLDKDGNKIGDAFARCNGLNTEQTWEFSATNNQIIETDSKITEVILDDAIITTL